MGHRPRGSPLLARLLVATVAAASVSSRLGAGRSAAFGGFWGRPSPRGGRGRASFAATSAGTETSEDYKDALVKVATALNVNVTATDISEPKALAGAIAGKVDVLMQEIEWQERRASEATDNLESCEVASEDAVAAFDEVKSQLKKSAAKAQARAFSVEMKLAPNATVPFSELNSTLQLLNQTQLECARAIRDKEAAESRIEQLQEELSQARDRIDSLLTGLRDVGKSVGVGGIGGIMMLVMSDEDLISDTKSKVNSLQRRV